MKFRFRWDQQPVAGVRPAEKIHMRHTLCLGMPRGVGCCFR